MPDAAADRTSGSSCRRVQWSPACGQSYTVNEVVDLCLERFAPAGKEALLALFYEAVLGKLREVVLARYRVDTQRALGADDFALNMAAGCGAAYLNVSGGVVIELGQQNRCRSRCNPPDRCRHKHRRLQRNRPDRPRGTNVQGRCRGCPSR